jgi:predicted metal-dependent hydrolase
MPIPIDRLIHSKRKTIALIIQSDGSLTVRAPLRMPTVLIQEFVQRHKQWIHKKQDQVRCSPAVQKKIYREGETFLFMGKEYPLILVAHQHPALTFNGSRFQLANAQIINAKEAFIHWYKTQAIKVIAESVKQQARINKFTYQKIRISSARTRWGSCSTNGTLSFTWRLVMAPPEVIEYVVLHELVHTQVRNHSQKFWQRVGALMPGYKQSVSWLKKNGKLLTLGE